MRLNYSNLRLVNPSFDSELTSLIMDLDYLRKKILVGTTPSNIFFQIKKIFHIIESIGSARIEGNHTTIVDYVDSQIEPSGSNKNEQIDEIRNMELALDFIDNNIANTPIGRVFLSELHKKVVDGLTAEGSDNPGVYRKKKVNITGSRHVPPDYMQVSDFMEELYYFINQNDPPQYDLLKTAIAHHRFAWIHPFDNGNGRTVRLLTYAMLVKQGFRVDLGRIINPTAVFCSDREKYYNMLDKADTGEDSGILEWCTYVLGGLKNEVEKVEQLANYNYLSDKILKPAIEYSLERKYITDIEAKILNVAIKEREGFKNADLKKIFPSRNPADISRLIRTLKDKKMIGSLADKSRKYSIVFHNNYLIRSVLRELDREGFLPIKESIS